MAQMMQNQNHLSFAELPDLKFIAWFVALLSAAVTLIDQNQMGLKH